MDSLSCALHLTTQIGTKIDTEVENAKSAPPLTESEKAESRVAKMEVVSALDTALASVQRTLRNLKKSPSSATTGPMENSETDVIVIKPPRMARMCPAGDVSFCAVAEETPRQVVEGQPEPTLTPQEFAKNYTKQTSGEGMEKPNSVLQNLAADIQPILTSFDKILVSGPSQFRRVGIRLS